MNRATQFLCRALCAVAVLFALSAAPPALAAGINVVVWGTITGPDALVNGMSYGTYDYFQYLNQFKGGIRGQKVNALLLDGRYKLDEELKIYRRAVDQEKAVVINGWSTGAAKALRDQTTKDRVAFMTESYSSEVLDPKAFPYIFIAGPTYEQQIMLAMRDLKKRGGKKVIIMHGDVEYGRGPVNVVRKSGEIEKLGLQLLDTIEFKYDAQDLTAQLLRVKQANPDLVYIQSSTNQTLTILRDAAKVGLKPSLFIGNFYNISPAITEQLGAAAEGFRAIQIYSFWGDNIPAMKQINEFGKKNKIAKKDIYYMKGWMEGIILASAIEKAIMANGGKVPDDIQKFRQMTRDALVGLKNQDTGGISPPVTYANHQGFAQGRMAVIKGGKYVPESGWIRLED